MSEDQLIALTLETLRSWVQEEMEANDDAPEMRHVRTIETSESYLENLTDALNEYEYLTA